MSSSYEPAPASDPDLNRVSEKATRRTSPWIKYGVPVAILIIVGAVLGGVLGTQLNKKNKNKSATGGNASSTLISSRQSSSITKSLGSTEPGRFPTSTDAYGLPVYPSTTDPLLYGSPTFLPAQSSPPAWPTDPFKPSNPQLTTVRNDRPRLMVPKYKWDALPSLIPKDAYLSGWNGTIFGNATAVLPLPPKAFVLDGSSGALDVAREIKERVKNLAYAYRLSNDSTYAERIWKELLNASGNGTTSFGTSGDNWNSAHFLDVGEFTAAFAIAYDWLYDYWSQDRRTALMWSIISLGIEKGIAAYNGASYGWWRTVNGNWNCVSNAGMVLGSLAILNDDPTGAASQMLGLAVPNAVGNCAWAPSTDGTWSETANYWYFGTTGHAEMTSSLLTATGGDYGLLNTNPSFYLTGVYHIYVTGMTSLFNYGDTGPNKFSTTANSMMFYGTQYKQPAYILFQRDRIDASEPIGLFWYDPSVSGAWWDNLPLDHYFSNDTDQFASMRTSWTDNDGLYVAMKAGTNSGHQTHNDLDGGDFVLDAMGQRFAGELGSGDYNAPGYFVGTAADSPRWLYYRKRTEGQNTLVVNRQNQELAAFPTTNFGSSNTTQGSSTVLSIPQNSTAFFTADLTATYGGTDIQRGIRLLNGRIQVLLQDDISNASNGVQWRMHTNATITLSTTSNTNDTATLRLGGKTVIAQILNVANGVQFSTALPVRYDTDPALPSGATDQPNHGVTVLVINIPSGTNSIQVLFNPQWDGTNSNSFITPKSVPVSQWSLFSHS